MNKSLRLSEKWFQRGLWLIAVVFASFLIGLGGAVVDDLPKVEKNLVLDDYLDAATAASFRGAIKAADLAGEEAAAVLEQAQLKRSVALADSTAASETLKNWLATRNATQSSDQDPELIKRTRVLDELKQKERVAASLVESQQQKALDAKQAADRAHRELSELQEAAQTKLNDEYRRVELRVFLYRLAVTLPLLAIAGWLFIKKRKSTYWPFVWGFVIFAGVAFFIELVPFLTLQHLLGGSAA